MDGFRSTLYQSKEPEKRIKHGVQVIHDRGNHWILASTMGCADNMVKIYYTSVDDKTKKVVINLFDISSEPRVEVMKTQKQRGGKDCGLFAIATATAIMLNINMLEIKFDQKEMRQHLVNCYTTQTFSMFPIIN